MSYLWSSLWNHRLEEKRATSKKVDGTRIQEKAKGKMKRYFWQRNNARVKYDVDEKGKIDRTVKQLTF